MTSNYTGKLLLDLVKALFFAFYVFLLYELIITPAVLDWSFYGIALAALIVFLLGFALPARVRLKWLVLGVTFLLAVKALNNLQDTSLGWQVGGALIIFAVLLVTGILAGGFRLRHFTAVFLAALLLSYTVDLTEIPFWSEFSVKWKSPLLYPKETSVDYFPLKAIDVDKDGVKEIVTQGNLTAAKDYLAKGRKGLEPLEPEESKILVFKSTEKGFRELKTGSYDPKILLSSYVPDYINIPYYKSEWSPRENTGFVQKLIPEFSKTDLISFSHDFGMAPFSALGKSLTYIQERKEGLDKIRAGLGLQSPLPGILDYRSSLPITDTEILKASIAGYTFNAEFNGREVRGPVKASGIIAAGKFTNQSHGIALLGKNLQVVALEGPKAGSVIGEIGPDQVTDISTSEFLIADINADGIDEILLNTEKAKVLQLKEDGNWEILWSSRDTSFRFEDFDTLGSSKKPEVIALSKSVVRNNATRYMTGYQYSPEGLVTQWRVFSGLINLSAADVDGDNEKELIGYSYRNHRIFVLEKHNVPVTQLLYGLTGLLIAYGLYLRFFGTKQKEVA